MKTIRVGQTPIRVKTYGIMADCVEVGVRAGWRRAHKHTDAPSEETICDAIEQAVMFEIGERFSFDDE